MSKPKIRFKGYTDEWEQRKLGEEAIEIIAGGDIDKSMVVENGKYPIYANALTDDSIVGYYDDYFKVVVESTGVPQLTVPQLSSYKIHFPQNIDEEKQIGAYFRNLDHLITLHQRKCDELQNIKKFMLQNMFV